MAMRNARKVRFPNIEVLMRRLNSILAAAILLLFMIHGILGTLTMVDAAMIITKHMARLMVVLIVIHTVLSCILTAKALKTWKVTGAPYFKENTLDFKEISTDENGEFNITIHLPKSNDYSQIIVDVMATDNKGESHNETKSFFLNKESLEFAIENEFLNQKESLKDITINVYNHDHVKYEAPVSVTLQKIKDIEKINDKNYKVEKEIWTKTLQPNEVIASSELKSLASGRYRLIFKIKDNKGREIENTKDFLLYSIYDKKVPEKTYDFYVPIVTQCKVGENATILLGSSDKSYVLLQIFANNNIVDTKWINIDNEIKTINIPYLKEYGNNINVTLTFAKESELYTHTANITLKKEPKNKPILGFESFRDLVTPGSKEKWVLKLKADSVSNYELCCTLYDQSLDAYQKNNW